MYIIYVSATRNLITISIVSRRYCFRYKNLRLRNHYFLVLQTHSNLHWHVVPYFHKNLVVSDNWWWIGLANPLNERRTAYNQGFRRRKIQGEPISCSITCYSEGNHCHFSNPRSTVILRKYFTNIPLKSCNIARIFIKLLERFLKYYRNLAMSAQNIINVMLLRYWYFILILL